MEQVKTTGNISKWFADLMQRLLPYKLKHYKIAVYFHDRKPFKQVFYKQLTFIDLEVILGIANHILSVFGKKYHTKHCIIQELRDRSKKIAAQDMFAYKIYPGKDEAISLYTTDAGLIEGGKKEIKSITKKDIVEKIADTYLPIEKDFESWADHDMEKRGLYKLFRERGHWADYAGEKQKRKEARQNFNKAVRLFKQETDQLVLDYQLLLQNDAIVNIVSYQEQLHTFQREWWVAFNNYHFAIYESATGKRLINGVWQDSRDNFWETLTQLLDNKIRKPEKKYYPSLWSGDKIEQRAAMRYYKKLADRLKEANNELECFNILDNHNYLPVYEKHRQWQLSEEAVKVLQSH